MKFHWDRIQSHIIEFNIDIDIDIYIYRVLDSVFPSSGTKNEDGIGQRRIVEPVFPYGKTSRSVGFRDRSAAIETGVLSPTRSEPRWPDVKILPRPTPPKTLQNRGLASIAKIPGGERPRVQPPEPPIYQFLLRSLTPRQENPFGAAGAPHRLLPLPDSEQLLSQHDPIQIDQEFRSQDLMPIPKIEHSGKQKCSVLLGNIADRSDLVLFVKRSRCQPLLELHIPKPPQTQVRR